MKFSHFAAIFLSIIIVMSAFLGFVVQYSKPVSSTEIYVGIYAGSTELVDLKSLITEVKNYTNLFVVGSMAITLDYSKLTEICQQLDSEGLKFLVFEHPYDGMPFAQWVREANQKWSQHFLGLYAYDEPGGYQIERTEYMAVKQADNYSDAADKYVANITDWLNQLRTYSGTDLPMYTSDYVFYEFDYRAGYDAVFTQFGWNHSRPLQVALCRGAATLHDKPWGAIITYENTQPPYYESGQQMYQDMVYAYENGAKYILLFDYDKNTTRTALQTEHLEALEEFWQYIRDNPRANNTPMGRIAFVLPKDYGFGFRTSNDRIWGLWEPDELSNNIWHQAHSLLRQYGTNLDIIYEDTIQIGINTYDQLIYWNGTIQTTAIAK